MEPLAELGCKLNLGVRAGHQQEPQQLGAYMGFFMLVPWVGELPPRGVLRHLDLVEQCELRWELVLWAFRRVGNLEAFLFVKDIPKVSRSAHAVQGLPKAITTVQKMYGAVCLNLRTKFVDGVQ